MYILINEDTNMEICSFYDRVKAEQEMAYLILEAGIRVRVVVNKNTAYLQKTTYVLDTLDSIRKVVN